MNRYGLVERAVAGSVLVNIVVQLARSFSASLGRT